MYRFYLKQDEKQVLLPIPPAQMETTVGNQNKTVYVLNFGEMNLAKKIGLRELRFTVLLPGRPYSFVQAENGFQEPEYFLNLFREYKVAAKPVQLIIFRQLADGTQLFCGNMEVLLEEYIVTEKGGEQGDFWVELCWKEWKTAKSIRYRLENQNGRAVLIEQGQERQTKQPAATYTVKKGDNLWNIAKKQLGDGSRYREIARKNGISNPSLIYPGQVLQL